MKPSKILEKYLMSTRRQKQARFVRKIHCAGKLVFDTFRQALPEAKIAERMYRTPTRVYQCPKCGKYHLTTRISREEKMERIFKMKV